MPEPDPWIAIGALAQRAGVATSTLRFYEAQGLIRGGRSAGNQRRYPKETLRRVAFIPIAQGVGLSLDAIRAVLTTLPAQRTPTPADWARLSRGWQPLLDARIDRLTALRDQLDGCIGCGCLSLKTCKLYNPGDAAAGLGRGARYLLGDAPADTLATESPQAAGRARGRPAGGCGPTPCAGTPTSPPTS
jgi:MerR family redox-sensitive transcriptional activator SoxR